MPLKMVDLVEISPHQRSVFGGKASGLARLLREGAQVPSGFAVEATLTPAGEWDQEDRSLFASKTAALLTLGQLAVRSSALGEDSQTQSFAGLFDTVLRLRSPEEALQAAAHCIASAHSERVRAYARGAVPPVGLVCQIQIESAIAGVCFTADPLGGDRGLIIEAVAGSGEALVSGKAQPEQWRAYRNGLQDWEVFAKPSMTQILSGVLVRKIAEQADGLAYRFGRDLDLEWALDANGALWWLQARPITAATPPPTYTINSSTPRAENGPITLWANWNFRETMPEPLGPFAWSLWRDVVAPMLIQAVGGIPATFPHLPAMNVVDRVQGRVYWNMNGVIALYGTGRFLALFVKTVDEGAYAAMKPLIDDGLLLRRRLPCSRLNIFMAALPVHLARLRKVPRFLNVGECLERMRQKGRELAQLRDRDLTRLDDASLCAALEQTIENRIFPFDEEFLALFLALSEQMAGRWLFRSDPVAMRMLTAGMTQNPTTLMSVGIDDLVHHARPVAHLFQGDTRIVFDQLGADPQGRIWLAEFRQFVAANGQRCPGEFNIAVPRWADDPTMLLNLVRAQLDRPESESLRTKLQRLGQERQAALDAAIAAAPWWKRPLMRIVARRVILSIPMREAPKHEMLIGFHALRKVAIEFGRRLVERDRMDAPEDVFYLEWSELATELKSNHNSLRRVIADRRKQHQKFVDQPAPDYLRSDGVPVMDPARKQPANGNSWVGTPVSGGIGRGPARIMRTPDPHRMRDGDVLVMVFADPGWTPLFPRAGALIMEVGGIMCHAAVVARELGIPAVFGLPGATQLLKDDQSLAVDGDKGTIHLD